MVGLRDSLIIPSGRNASEYLIRSHRGCCPWGIDLNPQPLEESGARRLIQERSPAVRHTPVVDEDHVASPELYLSGGSVERVVEGREGFIKRRCKGTAIPQPQAVSDAMGVVRES